MKKAILFSAVFAMLSSFSFADSVWHFKSGSRDIGKKKFSTVVVHNKTGDMLEVNDVLVYDDSESLFYKDSVVIISRNINSGNFNAVYSVNGDQLDVTIALSQNSESTNQAVVVVPPPPLFIMPPSPKPVRREPHHKARPAKPVPPPAPHHHPKKEPPKKQQAPRPRPTPNGRPKSPRK